jgi:hypothetical protein
MARALILMAKYLWPVFAVGLALRWWRGVPKQPPRRGDR